MTIIIGAGLSGLIAATQFPMATVIEANGPEALSHKAVLRFRTDALSNLTGIPFKKISVRKSIWYAGEHVAPNIQLANWYSRKTNGGILDRSIWNMETVERFIAPEDLQQQLATIIGDRIEWNRPITLVDMLETPRPIISTLPMPVLQSLLYVGTPATTQPEFSHKPIVVDRYRVKGANVYQTIYYPDPNGATHRVSITGDLMIRERSGGLDDIELHEICHSFGIREGDLDIIEESHRQKYGKIAPIDEKWRRNFIYEASRQEQVYSLGRFATWRNILLDDVVKDIAIIKRLIANGSYEATIHQSQKGEH